MILDSCGVEDFHTPQSHQKEVKGHDLWVSKFAARTSKTIIYWQLRNANFQVPLQSFLIKSSGKGPEMDALTSHPDCFEAVQFENHCYKGSTEIFQDGNLSKEMIE